MRITGALECLQLVAEQDIEHRCMCSISAMNTGQNHVLFSLSTKHGYEITHYKTVLKCYGVEGMPQNYYTYAARACIANLGPLRIH